MAAWQLCARGQPLVFELHVRVGGPCAAASSPPQKRKKAAEAKFAVSEELLFQAIVKRDRIVSKWIANNLLSMNENDTDHFIESAVKANLERPGDDDILEFFERTFSEKGLDFNKDEIVEQLATAYEGILEEESTR